MPLDLCAFGNGVDQFFRRVLRMARHKTDDELARHIVQPAQKVGKIDPRVQILSVGVHILPQEHNILVPLADKGAELLLDLFRRAAALPAAHIRNDAVRAEIVAPVHD